MTKFEEWFMNRIIQREVRQGPEHQKNIIHMYKMIRIKCEHEFYEDNTVTMNSNLTEWFEKKFKESNQVNEDTREILTILQEECAEVIVEVSKCFRFGPDQMMEGVDVTNIQRLQKELGDLQAMIELLVDNKVGVTTQGLKEAKKAKFEKLKQWSNLTINK